MHNVTSPKGRVKRLMSLSVFIFLSATIVTMASERVYWYWSGFTASSVLEISLFYLIPAWAGLWALARYDAVRLHHVVLGAAVFAAVTEGVLTPIIYTDGPLPLLAFMFIGWHGLVAFVGFWYLTRKWLVERARRTLGAASVAVGAGWGVWALSSSSGDLPGADFAEEGLTLAILTPGEFALYALGVGGVLALAHWLLGFVWPNEWRPSKPATWTLALVAFGYMAVAVIPAVIWAPAKLAILVGGPLWLLARPRVEDGETVWSRLAGRVRIRDAALILLMPVSAAIVYAGLWSLDLGDELLGGIYWTLISAQVIAGAVAIVWAIRKSLGPRTKRPKPPAPDRRAVRRIQTRL